MKKAAKTDYKTLVTLCLFGLVVALLPFSARVGAQAAPPATPPGSTLDQRVAQRKAERNITLATKDVQRLTSTCQSGQAKARAMQQKTIQTLDRRNKVYTQMDARLWITIGKLKIAQKDTFSYEKQRESFAIKISAFKGYGDAYKQSLDDMAVMNCKADTTGFKAMVETARIYTTQLRTQSTDIQNFVINDIKPALNASATDLGGKTTTQNTSN
jgi:hypothetical protein